MSSDDSQFDEIAMELDGLSKELDAIITGNDGCGFSDSDHGSDAIGAYAVFNPATSHGGDRSGMTGNNIMDDDEEEPQNTNAKSIKSPAALTDYTSNNDVSNSIRSNSAAAIREPGYPTVVDNNDSKKMNARPLLVKAASFQATPSAAASFGLDDFHHGGHAHDDDADVRHPMEELSAMSVANSIEQLPQLASKSLSALGDIINTITTAAQASLSDTPESSPSKSAAPEISELDTDAGPEASDSGNTISAVSGWMTNKIGFGFGLAAAGWSVASGKAKEVATNSISIVNEAVSERERSPVVEQVDICFVCSNIINLAADVQKVCVRGGLS
jgi:hypothetical protein